MYTTTGILVVCLPLVTFVYCIWIRSRICLLCCERGGGGEARTSYQRRDLIVVKSARHVCEKEAHLKATEGLTRGW